MKSNKFSREERERAVRMGQELSRKHPLQWAAIESGQQLDAHGLRARSLGASAVWPSTRTPTPEARVLFNTIERSYVGLEQIGQAIAELRGIHAGVIQIGCIPPVGMGVLPQIVRSFAELHPAVQI